MRKWELVSGILTIVIVVYLVVLVAVEVQNTVDTVCANFTNATGEPCGLVNGSTDDYGRVLEIGMPTLGIVIGASFILLMLLGSYMWSQLKARRKE